MMQLLRAADVAQMLKISKSQAYTLMRSGKMQVVYLGKSVRVDQRDLERYIATLKRGGRDGSGSARNRATD